ncbi:hypothetical protein [Fodinicola feengrottensis]|uniref:hypothetical protein n=1 Tax=Fodinicola feengrottensis TaxID=435914 RepID=UPI0013D35E68|nr:hypothetical protein [Fodinicola feengrottensis]
MTLPWYRLLRPDLGEGTPVTLMVVQVAPEYYEHLGAVAAPDGRRSRSGYLDAVLGAGTSEKALKDIVGVTVRVRADRAKRLAATLEAIGFSCTGEENVLAGPDVTITLVVDETAPEGVVAMRNSLRVPWEHGTQRFGAGCALDADGWAFTPYRWAE